MECNYLREDTGEDYMAETSVNVHVKWVCGVCSGFGVCAVGLEWVKWVCGVWSGFGVCEVGLGFVKWVWSV